MSSKLWALVESTTFSGPLGQSPNVLELTGLWVGVFLVGIVLQKRFESLLPTAYRRLGQVRVPGTNHLWWTTPSRLIERVVPGVPDGYSRYAWEVWRLDDLARGWGVIGIVILDSAAIELVFRGVPFVVATAVGQSPVIPVVLGSLLWVLLHDLGHLPIRLYTSAFFVLLWLRGASGFAIILSVATGLFGHVMLRQHLWEERGRYRTTEEAA